MYKQLSKKSKGELENYITRYQDKINGSSFSGAIVDGSLKVVNVYEQLVTTMSRGKINLVRPNSVSGQLEKNDEYEKLIKQIYCLYFPSFEIRNPLQIGRAHV